MNPELSACFPAYNEEENIALTIKNITVFLEKLSVHYEIIIVDDGSSDNTACIVAKLAQKTPQLRLLQHPVNQGYGAAIRTALTASRGQFIFFSDADGQFLFDELITFWQQKSPTGSVIGFRKNRQDNFLRKINGQLWTWLIKQLFHIRVQDLNCAFKLFSRPALDSIPLKLLTCQGAAINAELLLYLSYSNREIKELPVPHYPRTKGTPTGAQKAVILQALQELYRLYQQTRKQPYHTQDFHKKESKKYRGTHSTT